MNTKSTRRSQKQLLKRKPAAETATADHFPKIIDCGNFDEPQTTPMSEVPVIDCGKFERNSTEVVALLPPTPIAPSAVDIARGVKEGA